MLDDRWQLPTSPFPFRNSAPHMRTLHFQLPGCLIGMHTHHRYVESFVHGQVVRERAMMHGAPAALAASTARPSSSIDVCVSIMIASAPASTRARACSSYTSRAVSCGRSPYGSRIAPVDRCRQVHTHQLRQKLPGDADACMINSVHFVSLPVPFKHCSACAEGVRKKTIGAGLKHNAAGSREYVLYVSNSKSSPQPPGLEAGKHQLGSHRAVAKRAVVQAQPCGGVFSYHNYLDCQRCLASSSLFNALATSCAAPSRSNWSPHFHWPR